MNSMATGEGGMPCLLRSCNVHDGAVAGELDGRVSSELMQHLDDVRLVKQNGQVETGDAEVCERVVDLHMTNTPRDM